MTVKPVALISDAIRDCARRGDVVLDMFGWTVRTLIAADLGWRKARLFEYDPLFFTPTSDAGKSSQENMSGTLPEV